MPSNVYLNLTEEKKKRIIKAGVKEFGRVPFEEVSVKNIVTDANIARGSFYAYFEDKKDFLLTIINEFKNKAKQEHSFKGFKDQDLFEVLENNFIKQINEVSKNMQTENSLPPFFKMMKMLSSTPMGVKIMLKTSTGSLRDQIIEDYLKHNSHNNLSKQQTKHILEILHLTGKHVMKGFITGKITKEQASREIKQKFNIIKKGANNL